MPFGVQVRHLINCILTYLKYYVQFTNNYILLLRAGPNSTPLTKEQLQIATYFQSYQYGTATKAVRGIPVIYYSTRLANMCMGYVNYLRGKKESYLPSDRDTPLVNYELKDDEEEKYLPKGRDGVPLDRFMMIRRDVSCFLFLTVC